MQHIIHHAVLTCENVWCRLRSISDRPTDIPSGESNFYCLRMRLWRLCESAIWRNASEQGISSKRGGGGAERHLGVSLSGHLVRTLAITFRREARGQTQETSEMRIDNRRSESTSHRSEINQRQAEKLKEASKGFTFKPPDWSGSDHMQTTG